MCKHGTPSVILELPDWCDIAKVTRTVSIDPCIVDTVQALWDAGVETLGCCCGHGEDIASVVIGDGSDGHFTLNVLRAIHARPWRVQQWQLATVGRTDIPPSIGSSGGCARLTALGDKRKK